MEKKTDRIIWVDSIKGFAILCVVLGHVIGGYLGSGWFMQFTKPMGFIDSAIYSFHMPLFFAISGFVFRKAYIRAGKPRLDKIGRQAGNLFCCYLLYSAAIWAVKMIFSGDVNVEVTVKDILLVWARPIQNTPYWYLYVLTMFYAFFAITALKSVDEGKLFAVLFLFSLIAGCGFVPPVEWFEVHSFFVHALFFCAGYVYADEKRFVFLRGKGIMAAGIVSIFIGGGLLLRGKPIQEIPILSTIFALLISLFLFEAFKRFAFLGKNRLFNLLGLYCLEIYAIHGPLASGLRPVFTRLHIENVLFSVSANLVISIAVPILFSLFCKKLGIHALFFKPYSFFKRLCEKKA